MYLAYLSRAFAFVLLVPLLSRAISKPVWGSVLVGQALVVWLVLLLEFGFALSVARAVTVQRHDPALVARLLGDVVSAKIMLAALAAALAVPLILASAPLRAHPLLAVLAVGQALVQGFGLLWYYQASEQLYRFSLADLAGRALYLPGVLLTVRGDAGAPWVFGLAIVSGLLVNLWTYRDVRRHLPPFTLSWRGGLRSLREGALLSGFTLVTSVYTIASLLILGFFAPAAVLAAYGNADRLVRAAVGVIGPLNQMVFPRATALFHAGPQQGLRFARASVALFALLGLAGYAVGWLLADRIVIGFFGPQYADTVPYFRTLLWLLPLTAVNTALGFHVLLALRHDRTFALIYTVVSVLSLGLMLALLPGYGARALADIVVGAEVAALIALVCGAALILTRARQVSGAS